MLYVAVPEGNPNYFVEGTPMWKIAIVFWFMNGIWVVMPLAVMLVLWNKLALPQVKVATKCVKLNADLESTQFIKMV